MGKKDTQWKMKENAKTMDNDLGLTMKSKQMKVQYNLGPLRIINTIPELR